MNSSLSLLSILLLIIINLSVSNRIKNRIKHHIKSVSNQRIKYCKRIVIYRPRPRCSALTASNHVHDKPQMMATETHNAASVRKTAKHA